MWSNCRIWAYLEYRRRHQAWAASGMPKGREPYRWHRPSRKNPRWITHHGVAWWDEASQSLVMQSFVPLDESDLPWYLAWKAIFCQGRVMNGDRP